MTMRVDYKGMQMHGTAAEIVAFIRLYDGQQKPTTIPPWDGPFKPTWKPDLYAKTTTSAGTTVPKVYGRPTGDLTYEPLD